MSNDLVVCVDVKENLIVRLNRDLLVGLLKDRSTGKNIIWATSDYADLGEGYQENDEITIDAITGDNGEIIKPRSVKSKEEQAQRVRNMAEVFTPLWICNKQNNLVDSEWFGRENVFNEEVDNGWIPSVGKVQFPDYEQHAPKGWESYIGSKRLEITCGEAPYLVSRYDTVTGEEIPVSRRIGLLDRKFRVINERVRNFKDHERTKHRWLELAMKAVRSTYGFEWSGDNLLLARENVLYTVIEYYKDKFDEDIAVENLLPFVEVISWNIWQMDGIKCVIPNSCHDYVKERKAFSPSMFDTRAFSDKTLKRSVGFCDVNEDEFMKCQGCLKEDVFLHNGVYCKIKNWSTGKILFFKDLMNNQGSDDEVGNEKDFKFDVVIGNPPYQSESTEVVSKSNNQKPVKNIFQYFQIEANLLAKYMTCLIYPGGRWIHRFGKGLQDFGFEQINDPALDKVIFFPLANNIFERVQLADGISIVIKRMGKNSHKFTYQFVKNNEVKSVVVNCPGENLLPLDPRDIEICEKIDSFVKMNQISYLHDSILPRSLFRIESNFVEENPDKVQPYYAGKEYDKSSFIKLFTNDKAGKMGRAKWFLASKDVITSNIEYIGQWQVVVSSANAGGQKRDNQIEIIDNNSAFGRSRVALKSFLTREEAENFFAYANTYLVKYAFLMTDESLTSLGKRVPDILNYKYDNKIIDFSKDLDCQLYNLMGLNQENINYIESKVKNVRNRE